MLRFCHWSVFFLAVLFPFWSNAQGEFNIYENKGKYGLYREGGDTELKPKYDTIITAGTSCYILEKKGRYGLYLHAEKRNGDIKWSNDNGEGASLYKYERTAMEYTAYAGMSDYEEGYFYLADKTGNFAKFSLFRGGRVSTFAYKKVIVRSGYELCQETTGNWYVSHLHKSSLLEGDSIVLLQENALCLEDENKDGVYDKMSLITTDGELFPNLPYNPDLGKKPLILSGPAGQILADSKGNLISSWSAAIEPFGNGYFQTKSFKEGLAGTDLYGIIKVDGTVIFPEIYKSIRVSGIYFLATEAYNSGGWFASTSYRDVLADSTGKIMLSTENDITPLCEDNFQVGFKIFNAANNSYDTSVINIKWNARAIYKVFHSESYHFLNTETCTESPEFPVGYYYRANRSLSDVLFGFVKMVTFLPMMADIVTGNNLFGDPDYTLEKEYGADFSDGMALVGIFNDKGEMLYGYIDSTMHQPIPCVYKEASSFLGNIALVSKGKKYALIDKKNNLLSDFIYDDYEFFGEKMIIVKQSSNKRDYHVIDTNGNRVVTIPEFDSYRVNYQNTNEVIAVISGKKYALNSSGGFTAIPE